MTVETLVVIPCSYMPGRRPHPHKKQIHFQSHQTWPAGKSLHGIKVLMRKTSINQDFRLPGLNTGYKFNFLHGWNISVVEWSSKSHCSQPCSTQGTDPKSQDVSQFTAIESNIYRRFQSLGIGGRKFCDNSTSFPSGSQWWNTRWRTVLEDVIASPSLTNVCEFKPWTGCQRCKPEMASRTVYLAVRPT